MFPGRLPPGPGSLAAGPFAIGPGPLGEGSFATVPDPLGWGRDGTGLFGSGFAAATPETLGVGLAAAGSGFRSGELLVALLGFCLTTGPGPFAAGLLPRFGLVFRGASGFAFALAPPPRSTEDPVRGLRGGP